MKRSDAASVGQGGDLADSRTGHVIAVAYRPNGHVPAVAYTRTGRPGVVTRGSGLFLP